MSEIPKTHPHQERTEYPPNVQGQPGWEETLEAYDEENPDVNPRAETNLGDEASMSNRNRGDHENATHEDLGVPVIGSASDFPHQNEEAPVELEQGDDAQRMAEEGPIWDDDLAVENLFDEDAVPPDRR